MTLRPLALAALLSLAACEEPPETPSSSAPASSSAPPSSTASPPSPPTAPAPPTPAPTEPTPVATPSPADPAGDARCPPGQFFVHGGCHTGDSVGIAGPDKP